MDSKETNGIIEFDNNNIKCVIFKIFENNSLEILSTSSQVSKGIHNDLIINIDEATTAIRQCISEAEKKANVSLKKINVVLEQVDFLCTKISKNKRIDGSKIHKDDIDFLLKEGKKQIVQNDKSQTIIHIFNHNYIVDGKMFIEEPIGFFADSVVHEMSFVSIPKNNLKNINQVFINCDIELERLISKTFSLGIQTLKYSDLKYGAGIINLEFEKISLGLFKDLALVHSVSFPIGINHIIKDIAKVCSLDLEESKLIIKDFDFSFKDNQNIFDDNNFLKENFFINSQFRKISKSLIINVISERLKEMNSILEKQLIIPGFKNSKEKLFLLIENEFNLSNIEIFFRDYFGPNTNKFFNQNDKENYNLGKKFVACTGAIKLLKDGWETEAIAEMGEKNGKKIGFFSKIFGKLQ
jgi:cell division protein FtsA